MRFVFSSSVFVIHLFRLLFSFSVPSTLPDLPAQLATWPVEPEGPEGPRGLETQTKRQKPQNNAKTRKTQKRKQTQKQRQKRGERKTKHQKRKQKQRQKRGNLLFLFPPQDLTNIAYPALVSACWSFSKSARNVHHWSLEWICGGRANRSPRAVQCSQPRGFGIPPAGARPPA